MWHEQDSVPELGWYYISNCKYITSVFNSLTLSLKLLVKLLLFVKAPDSIWTPVSIFHQDPLLTIARFDFDMIAIQEVLVLHVLLWCQTIIWTAATVSAEVQSVTIDVSKGEVLVESALTTAEVQALIESTGRRAVLKGIGGSQQGKKQTVCMDVKKKKKHTKKASRTLR